MTDRLKPCPFCGGKATVEVDTIGKGAFLYSVVCDELDCVAQRKYYMSREQAVKDWNTRKPMDRIVEQLKEYQRNYSSGLGGFTDELVDRVLRNAIEIVKAGGKGE